MPTTPPRIATVASVLAFALAGCGKDAPGPAPKSATEAPAPDAGTPPDEVATPERQVISAELDAKVAGRKLPPRDTPLAVGMTGPDLKEMRDGAPAIVVFYRGHW